MIRKYKNLIPKVPASCVQAMEKSPLATKQIYRKTSPSM